VWIAFAFDHNPREYGTAANATKKHDAAARAYVTDLMRALTHLTMMAVVMSAARVRALRIAAASANVQH
jgi:hypothetical protein